MAQISRRQFLRGNFSGSNTVPRPPWALAEAAFASACTRCGDCINACPQHILVLDREARPTLDFGRGECTFCGKCVDACQPQALMKRELAHAGLSELVGRTWCAAPAATPARRRPSAFVPRSWRPPGRKWMRRYAPAAAPATPPARRRRSASADNRVAGPAAGPPQGRASQNTERSEQPSPPSPGRGLGGKPYCSWMLVR